MATFTEVLLGVYFSMARSGDAQSIRSYVYGMCIHHQYKESG